MDGDQQAGSPGDWRRIQANAQAIERVAAAIVDMDDASDGYSGRVIEVS